MSNSKLFMEGHELAVLNRYYIWLVDMVDFDSHDNYSRLLEYLHNKNYIWKVPNDDNRTKDGLELREKFKDETDYLNYYPLTRPCSVLEMLIAFSDRINKDVMDGEYTIAYWFWLMLDNLGLQECTDDNFDPEFIDSVLDNWMNRDTKNGFKSGNLTTLFGKDADFHDELWFQMQEYISKNYEK